MAGNMGWDADLRVFSSFITQNSLSLLLPHLLFSVFNEVNQLALCFTISPSPPVSLSLSQASAPECLSEEDATRGGPRKPCSSPTKTLQQTWAEQPRRSRLELHPLSPWRRLSPCHPLRLFHNRRRVLTLDTLNLAILRYRRWRDRL